MGNLFRPGSSLMRTMMLITNLICVNALWIICCIPVVTAGASTVAMYSVLHGYIRGNDEVVKPFFRAFKENFWQVTPLWLINLLIGAVMVAEIFYLSVGAQMWLKVIFGIVLFIYAAASSYLYPILARYETTRNKAIFNSFALATRHLLSSVCVVTMNLLPIVLAFGFEGLFRSTVLFWLLAGFSLAAYMNLKILLVVFKKYDTPEEE